MRGRVKTSLAPGACLAFSRFSQPQVSGWAGNSFYCQDPPGHKALGQRGDHGRTPWTRTVDAGFAYTPAWAAKKLSLELKVFNLFNSQTVTEYYEFSEKGGNNPSPVTGLPEPDPDFLNEVNYQTPRSVHFVVRYKF